MSKDLQQPKQLEEVDLGQLFNMVGNLFQRLFDFILSIFNNIYKLILVLLIHVYKRIKWYAISGIIGLILGFFIDSSTDEVYGANAYIETNFGSAHQVYENLKYLHQLAYVDKDSIELARKLNISVKDAASIKGIYMRPDIDENDRIRMFVAFKKGLDSLSREEYSYDDYIESLDYYSFKRHQVGVASTDKFIFQKLNKSFSKAISNNDYLNELKNVELRNFITQKETIEIEKKEIDSLASEYLKIRKNESKKQAVVGSGTNLYMGNSDQNKLIVDESELLSKKTKLEALKREINVGLVKNENIVNVVSEFPDAGYDMTDWRDKMKVRLPILFFLITFFGFILYGMGKYLSEQDQKINKK
ncbi:hypothetical protein [Algibacter pectinivorans]|uniref:Uncharacterized protein n=1 Tax=Algibacter pectinivorans TaxID=870482 RepID=A0A1I1NF46_9FLAO|nr:hypothetical protein [Algibacter pectinivorans]SFC96105.1 hypothetical protein SAMN04487987_102247 [Algibacter pectinivorans]